MKFHSVLVANVPMLIRSTGMRYAGSFRGGVGGADGSMVLAPSEAAFAGNMVPFAVGYHQTLDTSRLYSHLCAIFLQGAL